MNPNPYCDPLHLAPIWLLLAIPIVGYIRLRAWRRTTELIKATGLPEWKAWRLSLIEPIITTLVALFGYFATFCASLWWGAIFLPFVNMVLFGVLIRWRGKGSQRGRLASTFLFIRITLFLLVLPLFLLTAQFGFWALPLALIVSFIPFFIRMLFGLHQKEVTPSLVEYKQAQAAENIRSYRIEDSTHKVDLWDEQVVLSKRLKAEEERVEV